MKKIYTILVCLCMLAGFVACEKDKEFVLTTLTVTNETVTPSYETAEVSCSFKADATISEAYVQYSLSSGFAKYDVAKMTEEKGKYMAQLTDLVDNTTYYIRYAVSNKYSSVVTEEVVECQTLPCTVPTIVLDSIGEVRESHAKAYLHLTFDGGASVTDIGICWSKQANPTIEDIHKSTKDTVAVLDITDLQENTKYYVRAYAVNKVGTAYSEELVFTTESVLSEPTGTENGYGYVDLGLSVKWATMNVGANNPEEYGDYFAWGETSTKSTYNWSTYTLCKGSSSTLTKYNTSSSYGTVDNKTTLELSDDAAHVNWGGDWRMPTDAELTELLEQCTWTWTTQNGVNGYKVTSKSNGNSIFLPAAGYRGDSLFDGAGSIGYCWSSSLDTTGPHDAWHVYFYSGSVDRDYSYRYCGFSVRPVWGEYVMEETVPTIITATVTQITETTAVAGGNVTSDGGASVTERGVVYATTQNPTTADNKVAGGSGVGTFTCNLTGLQPNTTYYVRAYVENSKGTAYGEEVTFTTKANANISDPIGTENGYGYVDLGLSVKWATMNVGATKPEEYGDYFAWGETTTRDTYSWSTYKYCNGSDDSLTKYNTSSSYGTVDNKTQLELSDDAAHVNWGGSWRMPTDDELTELWEQCTWTWTTQNGVNGYKVTSKTNSSSIFLPATGYRYNSSLNFADSYGYYWSSSLYTGSPYRAWSVRFHSSDVYRNDGGYRCSGLSVRPVLGESVVETTIPTVTTTIPNQITETSAVAGGNVTSDGGAEITERGVVYATTQNPTTNNIKVKSGTGTGSFTCNLTGLQANTTYYVRAYAINSKGTAYGEEVTFATNKQIVLPSVTTAAITQITETSAVAGGNVTSDGGASVTERGVVYSTNTNPVITNLSNTIRPCGSGTGAFTYNMTGLQSSTTYYARAYAINEKGIAYGEEVSFTTLSLNGHEYVDLGLSVKWATMNVGASSPEDYGDYFAWGETEPKDVYDWSIYKWCNGSYTSLTKYNTSSSYGTVDNKTTLELSDDAARVNWGGSWRMPTDAELTELCEQCTWTWTTQNGVYGYKVTSKKSGYTNKSIFLPAASFRSGSSLDYAGSRGHYWSSSLYTDRPYLAWSVNFYSSFVSRSGSERYNGFTVRPVCP